jgi:ADP-ribose pyrophosphatase YjhB (NUDIX family)
VLMIRQYRHPVARQLWEIPAGLRDVTGEALADTARRELLEETGHVARDWHVLLDSYSSPGIITERMRVFLARGLQPADSGYQRHGEEKFLETAWVPLADAVAGALRASCTTARRSRESWPGTSPALTGTRGSGPLTRPRASRVPVRMPSLSVNLPTLDGYAPCLEGVSWRSPGRRGP